MKAVPRPEGGQERGAVQGCQLREQRGGRRLWQGFGGADEQVTNDNNDILVD